MRARLLLTGLLFFSIRSQAQMAQVVDSIKDGLTKVKTIQDKAYLLDNLSRTYMNVNLQEAEKYGEELIQIAEESRDRNLMVFAYASNGDRCTYLGGQNEYTQRTIGYYNKALNISRENKMDTATGGVLLRMALVQLNIPDKEKALSYANEAFSLISTLSHDSLRMESHNVYGQVYLARNEKIMALRHFLNALRVADEYKARGKEGEARKATWLRTSYVHLSDFYSALEAYDKAIDYRSLALKTLDQIDSRNVPYQRVLDINYLGNLFAAKKSTELATSHYRRSIAMADSLKFTNLKVPAYISLLNQYLRDDKPDEALKFMNSDEGKDLARFLREFGFASVVDQALAVIYTNQGRLDSADYYFERAQPYFERTSNMPNLINFYAQRAYYYKKKGDLKKAAEYYLRVKDMSETMGSLEFTRLAAQFLDTVYRQSGKLDDAMRYNAMYYQYKDSIETLNREKELAQVEANDEQQRLTRIRNEELEAKRKRYNIQYLAITIGIAGVFVLMVMMGMFKVSATTIKLVGFFAFLMFFEFIFLIFKKNITSITDGEPWKDLLFMIGLAALLLPLHHWLEHKVIHYLTSHNRLTATGQGLLERIRGRKKAAQS